MRKLLLFCIALSALVVQSAMAQTNEKEVKRWESECARGDEGRCTLAVNSYYIGKVCKLDLLGEYSTALEEKYVIVQITALKMITKGGIR